MTRLQGVEFFIVLLRFGERTCSACTSAVTLRDLRVEMIMDLVGTSRREDCLLREDIATNLLYAILVQVITR